MIDSIALLACNKIVPPGVSYTPLDFIPTNLFSTISILPIPFLPPKSFSFLRRFAGVRCLSFIAIGSPFLNSIVISVGSFGACKGLMVLENICSCGSIHGSSRIFPSAETCKRFASTLNGASPLLSFVIVIWCFSAYRINFVLDESSHSLQGAIT